MIVYDLANEAMEMHVGQLAADDLVLIQLYTKTAFKIVR